jgi:hypothetical protein
MTDDNVNPDQIPSEPVPAGRQANGAPPPTSEEDRWDHEPTWPGGEYGNDNDLVADGTCDDAGNERQSNSGGHSGSGTCNNSYSLADASALPGG